MKKKILSLLVLLMTAATGAWAEEETLLTTITATGASTYSETVAGVVTLSFSNIRYIAPYGWLKLDMDCTATVTVEPTAAYNVTRCVFYQTNNGCLADDLSPFTFTRYGYPDGSGTYVDTANGRVSAEENGSNMDGVTSIEVYGTPAFDYKFTVADSDHGTGKVQFFIGGKEVKGAMQADEGKTVTMTVTPDAGWILNTVTANATTDWGSANARMRGAAPNIPVLGNITLTPDNDAQVPTWTFEMPPSSVEVSATYKKVSTLYFDPAGKTSLVTVEKDGTAVTPTEGKLTNVLEGSAINLKANTGYKFRKVAVKKGAALKTLTIGGVTLTYAAGDTWEQVIAKNSDKLRKSISDDVETVDGSAFLRKGTDIVKITHTVDPNATDYNWYEM